MCGLPTYHSLSAGWPITQQVRSIYRREASSNDAFTGHGADAHAARVPNDHHSLPQLCSARNHLIHRHCHPVFANRCPCDRRLGSIGALCGGRRRPACRVMSCVPEHATTHHTSKSGRRSGAATAAAAAAIRTACLLDCLLAYGVDLGISAVGNACPLLRRSVGKLRVQTFSDNGSTRRRHLTSFLGSNITYVSLQDPFSGDAGQDTIQRIQSSE